jgi:hypothetical protein
MIAKLRRKGAQGLVEFALILPVFLVLVYGIIEAARLMMTYSSVYTASREGARYGAAIGEVSGSIPRYKDCTGIRNASISNGFLAGVQSANIDIRYDTGPDDGRAWDALPTCPASVILGDRVVVRVAVTYEPIVPLANIPPLTVSNSDGRTIILDFQVMGTAPASPTPKATRTATPTNTPPTLIVPASDITREATGPSNTYVTFNVSANDVENHPLEDKDIKCINNSTSAEYTKTSSGLEEWLFSGNFSLGTTTVKCTVTDWDGASISNTFDVIIEDKTPPTIAAHANIGPYEATSSSGASVTYTSSVTFDIVDGAGTANCSPGSGSTFAIGISTVTCNATDSHGNVAAPTTFTVTVVDTSGPVIAPHGDVGPVAATSPSGAIITYTSPSTLDLVDGSGTATCSPVSGSTFPVGTNVVTCNATDSHGNAATPTTFNVVVSAYIPSTCTTITISNATWYDYEYHFDIQNSDVSTHKIDSFTISWTGTAQATYTTLGSSTIWTGPSSSPVSAATSGDPSLGNGTMKRFELNFNTTDHSGESFQLNFASGCYVTVP